MRLKAEPLPRRTAGSRTAARRRRSGADAVRKQERASAGFAAIKALLEG
jgi:hypothetical protein